MQMNALRTHFEKQHESRRFQMSQMEAIIQQQSEQIKAQQLQIESMNMQMKKLMDSIRPFADPIVQTASMTVPASTEVKLSAPLTELAAGSGQKPSKPIAPYMLKPPGSWDLVENECFGPYAQEVEDNSDVTCLRSPTLPPASAIPSDAGNRNNPPGGNGPPDGDSPDGEDAGKPGQRGNGGKRPPTGGRRPPGGGPGDGDDDGDGDGDDEPDDEDEDRNFIRRMRALFGNSIGRDPDKSKVKGAALRYLPFCMPSLTEIGGL